ncbi:MAG TPA: PHP domain-containing protein [Clostridiales bacterium]|nr:PHP domain-containing protein [Clostridiales bacterium]
MLKLSYDLHIHSCLSPCGDEDMTPANIVAMSALKGLDVIAVTDHNSCKNCPAVLKWAKEYGLIAIPGMELCTMEEVHALCLFEELSDALRFDEYVYSMLMRYPNDERAFGKQEIYDDEDQLAGTEPYLLINATNISFDELGGLMKKFGGVYIPAHIDKNSNSLISNLGFISPDADFVVAELANKDNYERLGKGNPYLYQCNIITDSDAHSLGDINEASNFLECGSRSSGGVLEALTKSG